VKQARPVCWARAFRAIVGRALQRISIPALGAAFTFISSGIVLTDALPRLGLTQVRVPVAFALDAARESAAEFLVPAIARAAIFAMLPNKSLWAFARFNPFCRPTGPRRIWARRIKSHIVQKRNACTVQYKNSIIRKKRKNNFLV